MNVERGGTPLFSKEDGESDPLLPDADAPDTRLVSEKNGKQRVAHLANESAAELMKQQGVSSGRQMGRRELLKAAGWIWASGALGGYGTRSLLRGIEKDLEEWAQGRPVNSYIDLVKQEEQLTSEAEKELREKLAFLREQFSDTPLFWLAKSSSQTKERRGGEKRVASLDGFNDLAMISEKDLEKVWLAKNSYPQHWINEVDSVSYEPHPKGRLHPSAHYNLSGETAGSAHNADRSITLYNTSADRRLIKAKRRRTLANEWDGTFSHELGHINDWNGGHYSARERIEFLERVTRAYLRRYSDTRDKTWSYPDQITNDDVYAQRYSQVTEWWAELCEDYLQSPRDLHGRRKDLYELVDAEVRRGDPGFRPDYARNQRRYLIQQYVK